MFSLGESKVEKLMGTLALGLNVVTHSKLIRTYPAGTRTDSSNYNPVPMWNHGCQIGEKGGRGECARVRARGRVFLREN